MNIIQAECILTFDNYYVHITYLTKKKLSISWASESILGPRQHVSSAFWMSRAWEEEVAVAGEETTERPKVPNWMVLLLVCFCILFWESQWWGKGSWGEAEGKRKSQTGSMPSIETRAGWRAPSPSPASMTWAIIDSDTQPTKPPRSTRRKIIFKKWWKINSDD